MTIASGTATNSELVTLYKETYILQVMLRQFNDGSATDKDKPGRFTPAQMDAQVTKVSNAITAINAGP